MRVILAVLLLSLFAGNADAFHEVASFAESANTGGGAGNYFSGSPNSKGYQCQLCHVATEGKIKIGFSSGLSGGSYRPGLIYTIILKLEGEHKGLESAFNPNTFTAEMTDTEGNPVGRFSASQIELENDYTVAIAEGLGNGESEWEFTWWAPEVAVPATLYIAMLDGDGASDPERRFIDPLNDDIATLELPICPEGEVCTPPMEASEEHSPAGCSSGGHGSPAGFPYFVFVLALGIRRRTPNVRSNEA